MSDMNNKNGSPQLQQDALQLVEASRRLDYHAILAHDPVAIARLRQVATDLRLDLDRLRKSSDQALADYAQAQPQPRERQVAPEVTDQERRRRCVDALTKAGLGGRLGKLYSSGSAQRLVPFREAPHKRGLVPFDMVVAADYMPGDGFHGIFVTAGEVISGLLMQPVDERSWQLRARAPYANLAQMVEKVGLMSAGFPVN